MWDLFGPGIRSVSPALAGGFLTFGPPGKSRMSKMRVTGEKEFLGTAELELVLSIINQVKVLVLQNAIQDIHLFVSTQSL